MFQQSTPEFYPRLASPQLPAASATAPSVAATGTTQGGAAPVTAVDTIVTGSAGNTGVILPALDNYHNGAQLYVRNSYASSITVYPPTGGTINGGTTNAGLSVAAGKSAQFTQVSPNNYWAIVSN